MRESEAMAVLVCAKGIGYARRAAALASAGSAENLLADPEAFSRQLGAGGPAAIRRSLANRERMMDDFARQGVCLLLRGGKGYPRLLEHTAQPPHLLFVLGKADLDDAFPLAVVGTRRASAYGLRQTRMIACALAKKGMSVVSGLALGIDAAAHRGALEAGGRTIAVLGSALDEFYPEENRDLFCEIVQCGGSVVSEYAPGTRPARYTFPQRNRIVAGMSLGVLVTDAPMRSGAMITVNAALSEGREVFALPGDVDRPGSQLPNRLIAEGARPVLSADDILQTLVIETGRQTDERKWFPHDAQSVRHGPAVQTVENAGKNTPPQETARQKADPRAQLDENGRRVYDLLLEGDGEFDALCERTGIGSEEMGSLLMLMELDGIIESLPGLSYRLT